MIAMAVPADTPAVAGRVIGKGLPVSRPARAAAVLASAWATYCVPVP
jgi:hypothetical protein